MNTETVRLNITLPKDLAASLDQYAGPGRKSRFIAQAIRKQIESRERQVLEKALEAAGSKIDVAWISASMLWNPCNLWIIKAGATIDRASS